MLIVVLCAFAGGAGLRTVVGRTGRGTSALDPVITVLQRWVIVVALPALILHKIPGIPWGSEVLIPVSTAWTIVVLGSAAVLVASRALTWPRRTTGTLLLLVPLGNTSFLGVPAIEVLLGRDHLGSALAFDQGGSFLALATFGSIVVGRYGLAAPESRALAAGIRRMVRFPPFLALVTALVVRATGVPAFVDAVFDTLGTTVGPAAMCALGMRLNVAGAARHRRLLAGILGWRLVVVPAMVLAVAVTAGDPTAIEWRVAVLQSAMPTMVTAGILAGNSGLDGELAALVVGVGTLGALVTLPAWAWLMGLIR